jgi:molybdenum cofactor biosynthesis enzyme MoaA
MDYYKILKFNRLIKNDRLKILGFGILFLLRRRHLNIFLDPVLNCNFRCLMCHFSDPDFKPEKDKLKIDDIDILAKKYFRYALRVQIGCAAEPTIFLHNDKIIYEAKKYKVPYVSLTTNASLLNYAKINQYFSAGLDEIIISMHGFSKEIYEKMMPGAKIEHLHQVLSDISELKKSFPSVKLRLNFTLNPDNVDDLTNLKYYLDNYNIDIVQIRPLRKLGNTAYSDFDIKRIQTQYSIIIEEIEKECKQRGVVTLITKELPDEKIYRNKVDIANYTYCYLSPIQMRELTKNNLSYYKIMKQNGIYKKIFKDIFINSNDIYQSDVRFGNYDVNI